jgi:hypothetical protein
MADVKNRAHPYQCAECRAHNLSYTSPVINVLLAAFDAVLEVYAFELTIINICTAFVSIAL